MAVAKQAPEQTEDNVEIEDIITRPALMKILVELSDKLDGEERFWRQFTIPSKLAEDAGVSESTVRNHEDLLEDIGAIFWVSANDNREKLYRIERTSDVLEQIHHLKKSVE